MFDSLLFNCLQNTLADLLAEHTKSLDEFDIVCGVPYTALPIATSFSVKTGVPMVMRRKEAKDYGTKKLIEGSFKENDRCLIVEDVVTSGSSILETVSDLVQSGIKCSQAVVLLNREQGGEKFLKERGITMHALLSLTQLMQILKDARCVDEEMVAKVREYLKNSQVDASVFKQESLGKLYLCWQIFRGTQRLILLQHLI